MDECAAKQRDGGKVRARLQGATVKPPYGERLEKPAVQRGVLGYAPRRQGDGEGTNVKALDGSY